MIVFSGRCRVGRSVLIVMQRYGRLITGWCSTFADMLASMNDICFLWLYPLGGGRLFHQEERVQQSKETSLWYLLTLIAEAE